MRSSKSRIVPLTLALFSQNYRSHALVHVAVIGGGPSGIFSAVSAAENGAVVTVFEAGGETLTKVKISGGGRCNVLHDTSKPVSTLLAGYPRGSRELNGLLNKGFTPIMAKEWFESRGVELKTEVDGRMFPRSDSSQTIIDTLLSAASEAGVNIIHRCKVDSLACSEDRNFVVEFQKKGKDGCVRRAAESFDSIVLATGSAKIGFKLAESLGHDIVPTVPSLFTLSTKHDVQEGGTFYGLAGLSVPHARVSFSVPTEKRKRNSSFVQEGPLLITHHGLSAGAALRLSAFGALDLHRAGYQVDLRIHWAPSLGNTEEVFERLWQMTRKNPRKLVSTSCPLMLPGSDGSSAIPRRLWSSFCNSAGFSPTQKWCEAPKKITKKLASLITNYETEMTGKGTFKEEFVTAGGVSLKQINMKTMESKSCQRLFFCGELLNVDGVTGGFNFLNCWATGYVAGTNAAQAQDR